MRSTIMADVFNKEERSRIMRSVKSKNTKSTELAMVKLLKENHITGWRRTYPVKGHPDFVFLDKRVAVFVDGCFWHGHNCRNTKPSDNAEYWQKKRERNMKHDREVTASFEKRGWRVIRIWECELKRKNISKALERLCNTLNSVPESRF